MHGSIWKKWAEKENVQVEFLFDSRKRCIQAVQEGLADFHAGLVSGGKWGSLARPFYELEAGIFYPHLDNGKERKSLADLQTVAAFTPSYAELLQRANPAVKVILVSNYGELFSKISKGEVEAFIDDVPVVRNLLLRQGRQGEYVRLANFSHVSKVFAVVHGENEELLESINRGLGSISMAEYRQMENKWLVHPETGYYHSLKNQLILTKDEKKWLQLHPVIRIGVDRSPSM